VADVNVLFEAAKRAQANAYVPYSQFKVGAALLADDGQIYAGCNVENAAYPTGSCAETGAISAMIAGGGRKIVEALVIGDGKVLCTPCGNCRQRLREFAAPSTSVHVADITGIRQTFSVAELLPASFGPDNLTR
jgi:cytidine deaminase